MSKIWRSMSLTAVVVGVGAFAGYLGGQRANRGVRQAMGVQDGNQETVALPESHETSACSAGDAMFNASDFSSPAVVGTGKGRPASLAVGGTAVLGLSFYLGAIQDTLLGIPVFGEVATVVIVSLGWLVPAVYCVNQTARRGNSGLLVEWVPRLALFSLLLTWHTLGVFALPIERASLLSLSCFAAALLWVGVYRLVPGFTELSLSHALLDITGLIISLFYVGPKVLGAGGMIAESDAKFALILFIATGVVATFLMTAMIPCFDNVLVRSGAALLSVVLYATSLISVEGGWSVGNALILITAVISGLTVALLGNLSKHRERWQWSAVKVVP